MLLRCLAFLSVIGGCFSTSVLAEPKVLHVTETGFMVENKVTISQSADKVWHALINKVDKWWPKDHTWWGNDSVLSIDEFAGGCFCEKVGYKSAEHMRISFVEPQKLLRMTGGLAHFRAWECTARWTGHLPLPMRAHTLPSPTECRHRPQWL